MDAVELASDEVIGDWVEPNGPGAAVAVVRTGEPTFLGAFGMADLELETPVTPSTRFPIASVSKQFTGACLALAIEAGLLAADDHLREFIPELADFADPITLEHLIRHTSGLRDVVQLLPLAGWRDWDVTTHTDALELILGQREGNFAPGSSWSYSNTGYVLLAEVLQRVTGRSFRALASDWIFEPLRMDATHVQDDPRELVPGRSRSYMPGADGGLRSATSTRA